MAQHWRMGSSSHRSLARSPDKSMGIAAPEYESQISAPSNLASAGVET
jgi:hypothetical protein